jgi:hypothetical protein
MRISTRVVGGSTRRFPRVGGRLSVGAVLTALALLGAASPASAQAGTWPVVPSASAPQRIDNQLGTVSCVSATACTAAGYYVANSGNGPQNTFIESWNGTRWAIVPSPNPYT